MSTGKCNKGGKGRWEGLVGEGGLVMSASGIQAGKRPKAGLRTRGCRNFWRVGCLLLGVVLRAWEAMAEAAKSLVGALEATETAYVSGVGGARAHCAAALARPPPDWAPLASARAHARALGRCQYSGVALQGVAGEGAGAGAPALEVALEVDHVVGLDVLHELMAAAACVLCPRKGWYLPWPAATLAWVAGHVHSEANLLAVSVAAHREKSALSTG